MNADRVEFALKYGTDGYLTTSRYDFATFSEFNPEVINPVPGRHYMDEDGDVWICFLKS